MNNSPSIELYLVKRRHIAEQALPLFARRERKNQTRRGSIALTSMAAELIG